MIDHRLKFIKAKQANMMDDSNDDSMFIDPEILKKELVISLPILSESDIERMINGEDSSTEGSSIDDGDKEKFCPKRDLRRLNLLNDPNYAIVLSFLGKFRSYVNLKNYPLRIFEDNLISEQDKLSARFIDLHLTLLKKISSGKSVERNEFVSSMTKFAYRYDRGDGGHLEACGYAKAKVETKLRILKNLVEQQFDRNQPMKNVVANKSASDLCSRPFGRDRLGASYWLFIDTDCFIRLFREDVDADRTWINLAKNPQELENLLKILVADYRVRKKFPDWKFAYPSFNSIPPSRVFEEHYSPGAFDMKTKGEWSRESSPSSIRIGSTFIKNEHLDLDPVVNLDRDLPASPTLSPVLVKSSATTNFFDITSDQESINSEEIVPNRVNTPSSSSTDTRESIYSTGNTQATSNHPQRNEEIERAIERIREHHTICDSAPVIVVVKPTLQPVMKRKLVDYDDTDSENESEDSDKHDETVSQEAQAVPAKETTKNNLDLPIALRRPRRNRRAYLAAMSPDSSSTTKSTSQSSAERRSAFEAWRRFDPSSKANGRGRRSGRGRRRRQQRGRSFTNGFSSTTSDDRQPSDDDDDDFEEALATRNTEFDNFLNGDLLADEDDDDDYIPRQMAKTVAKCYNQSQYSSKSCLTCLQAARPEFLLLCQDCDDAYHIDCLKPELLSVPSDDWYCPLCEHKRLCDGLIEKLLVLLKDQVQFEMKRKITASKRRRRLTNVTVNIEQPIKPPVRKRQINVISSSDDTEIDNEKAKTVQETNTINADEDDDDDSVYGRKNDENRKPVLPEEEEEQEQEGKRRVRSCRRKTQTYCLDEYDKKIQDALASAGVNRSVIEDDSDDSERVIVQRKSSKKRTRYERDEDFDASNSKHDADFVPSRRRTINDDSRSNPKDNNDFNDNHEDYNDYNDIGMSDDDSAWRNRRQSSVSSSSKKKSAPKSNRTLIQSSPSISDDDTIIYGDTLSNSPTEATIKSEPVVPSDNNENKKNPFDISSVGENVLSNSEAGPNLFDKNRFGKNVFGISELGQNITTETGADKTKTDKTNKPKRQRRAPPKKKKSLIQQENISDEDDKDAPPLPKHRPARKRRDSNDSPLEEDDDYEKLAHKRRLYNQGRGITRTSITSHIKKLVGDEDDDDEEEEEEENEKDSPKDKAADEATEDKKKKPKKATKNAAPEEVRLSDDDEFPDDQEILKATGLINLKRPLTATQAASFRVPYMPTIQSYQFSMADPTAHFDFTCQPEEPSDASQANGDTNLSTTTT